MVGVPGQNLVKVTQVTGEVEKCWDLRRPEDIPDLSQPFVSVFVILLDKKVPGVHDKQRLNVLRRQKEPETRNR